MKAAPSIIIHNSQRKARVAIEELQEFADAALAVVLRRRGGAGAVLGKLRVIDVVLVSDARMAALHKRFMNVAEPTDVITFQHGEIFISAETAKANARRFRTTAGAEIRLYIAHGLLHLAGLDDRTPAAAQVMARAQERVVAAASRVMQRARAQGRTG